MKRPSPYGVVYLTARFEDGVAVKYYIGQTCYLRGRLRPWYKGSGVLMQHAIKKHGNKAFVRKVVEICPTKEALNAAEKKWIRRFNATESERFYNLAEGGGSCANLTGKSVFQYTLGGQFIREFISVEDASIACGCATSQMTLTCQSSRRTAMGYIWSFQKRTRIPARKEGVTRAVCKYTEDGVFIESFSSVTKAAQSISQTTTGNIIACCKGGKKSAGGFLWKYAEDSLAELPKLTRRTTATPVVCCDLATGAPIQTYASHQEASAATGAHPASINRALRTHYSAGGFLWKRP